MTYFDAAPIATISCPQTPLLALLNAAELDENQQHTFFKLVEMYGIVHGNYLPSDAISQTNLPRAARMGPSQRAEWHLTKKHVAQRSLEKRLALLPKLWVRLAHNILQWYCAGDAKPLLRLNRHEHKNICAAMRWLATGYVPQQQTLFSGQLYPSLAQIRITYRLKAMPWQMALPLVGLHSIHYLRN